MQTLIYVHPRNYHRGKANRFVVKRRRTLPEGPKSKRWAMAHLRLMLDSLMESCKAEADEKAHTPADLARIATAVWLVVETAVQRRH